MRAFVVTVFMALASAAPQYNYQQSNFNNQGGAPYKQTLLRDALQNKQISQALLGPAPAGHAVNLQQIPFRQQLPINGVVLQQQYIPQIQHVHEAPQYQQQQQQFNYQTASLAPVVTKDIYVHAAPEEPEEQYVAPPAPVLAPRKHYRIVFIKAPTQRVRPATLRLTQAPTEEKTIIYVLSKKPDPLDLQTVFQDVAPKQPSKPEVYFIKYKTQEEAAHAQRTIQAQFDTLGGTSDVSDEGIAPVTSVIGSLENQEGHRQQGLSGLVPLGSNAGGSEGHGYLPPNH